MLRLDNYGYSQGIQGFFNGVHNFNSKSLLYLQPSCVSIYDPSYFAKAGYPSIRYISYMGFPKKREHMMFTHTVDLNILDYDHLADRFVKFSGVENGVSIRLITLRKELHCFS